MNYFLVRNRKTRELDHVYKTKGWIMGNSVEEITQAEFETYKAFGIRAIDDQQDETRVIGLLLI